MWPPLLFYKSTKSLDFGAFEVDAERRYAAAPDACVGGRGAMLTDHTGSNHVFIGEPRATSLP